MRFYFKIFYLIFRYSKLSLKSGHCVLLRFEITKKRFGSDLFDSTMYVQDRSSLQRYFGNFSPFPRRHFLKWPVSSYSRVSVPNSPKRLRKVLEKFSSLEKCYPEETYGCQNRSPWVVRKTKNKFSYLKINETYSKHSHLIRTYKLT